MAESKAASERARRQLKVELPPGLKQQLKREAVDLDVPLKLYVEKIFEGRLPWDVMKKLEDRAKREGLSTAQFLLKILRQAGVLDD